jgi:hypothetical protein
MKETKIDYELKTFKSSTSSTEDRLKAAFFLAEKKNTYGTSNGGEFNTKQGKKEILKTFQNISDLKNGSLDYNSISFLQKQLTAKKLVPEQITSFLDCFEYDSQPFKVKQELYGETILKATGLREETQSLKPSKSNEQALTIADDANALISLQSSLKSINPDLKNDPKIQKYFDAFNNGISEMLILCSSNDPKLLNNTLEQLLSNGKLDLEKYLKEAVNKKFGIQKKVDAPPPASVSLLDNFSKKVKNGVKAVKNAVKNAASEVASASVALGQGLSELVRGKKIEGSEYVRYEIPFVPYKTKTAANKAAVEERKINKLLASQQSLIDKNLGSIVTEVSKHLRFSPDESIQILTVLPKYVENQKKIIQDEILPEMESVVKSLYEITSQETQRKPLLSILSSLESMREGGAKRRTYKKKNIHIKKQTHRRNHKKPKRKTTIKHKKVNKKKYTKENR